MARLVKSILVVLTVIFGIAVLASIALFLFFDPNDFREDISEGVKKATGRELVIEGDLSLSIFPWVAVEIGRTTLGNAEGFGDDPMLSFDSASLSVQLMPLIFSQKVSVGTASLDGLNVNLAVNSNGVTNWDDLSSAEEPTDEPTAEASASATLDIANVSVSNANVVYKDVQAGSTTSISDLNFNSGRIAEGSPFDLEAEFNFDSDSDGPDDLGGNLSFSGTFELGEGMATIDIDGLNISGNLRGVAPEPTEFNLDARAMNIDTEAERITLGEIDVGILGISMAANVEPFSYAGDPQPKARLQVHEFSLKELMQTLGEEAPETADPAALTRVSFAANAAVGINDVALNEIEISLDDTTMKGTLILPKSESGALKFDLSVDSIVVDHYMAPTSEDAAQTTDEEPSNVEIPVDLIRALNAQGKFTLAQAMMSGIAFENMQVTLNAKGGKLRLHPLSADMFGGSYSGDIRIDARTDTPILSVHERIVDVQMGSLAKAMFDVDNISGKVNGKFELTGKGADTDSIQRSLGGTMMFELKDGEYQGTDVWHELRVARAKLKGEAEPAPRLPPRTEFTSVTATGSVTDGVLTNNDFLAQLPFLRLTGRGTANFVEGVVDYTVDATVVENPEFAGDVSEAELNDFTAAVIPMRITGPLASPSIRPDVEALIRQEVEKEIEKRGDEIKNRLLNRLFGGDDEPEGDEGGR